VVHIEHAGGLVLTGIEWLEIAPRDLALLVEPGWSARHHGLLLR
jgi:hypothetical protein